MTYPYGSETAVPCASQKGTPPYGYRAQISTFLPRIHSTHYRCDNKGSFAYAGRKATEVLAASIRYVHLQLEEAEQLKRVKYWWPAVKPRYASEILAPSPPSDQLGTGAEGQAPLDSCPSATAPDPQGQGS